MGGAGRTLLTISLSGHFFTFSRFTMPRRLPLLETPKPTRVFQGFRPLCTATATTPNSTVEAESVVQPLKHISMLLESLRLRALKDSAVEIQQARYTTRTSAASGEDGLKKSEKNKKKVIESFEELGLSEEVMCSVREMGIEVPTEIQRIGIPAVLEERSVVLGSHGSGKTLAYLLPLVQLLRRDEEIFGMLMKANHPRAVVLCPTRKLSQQVFQVAQSISHHARFRSTLVSGGGLFRPQEDSLNGPIDLIVGTPGRVLRHIEEGNIVYGDIKYLVLDEADTMFLRGFDPNIRKFLGPLRNRASKPDGKGFQTVLVTGTMTKAVQSLINEEFQGIEHLYTFAFCTDIASAIHAFQAELKAKFQQERIIKCEKLTGANLYLKNLDDGISEEKLKDLFSEFGTITSCKVMIGQHGLSKGCGFVAFSSPDDATRALNEMNGKMIGRKPLYVAVAQRKEEWKARLQELNMLRLGLEALR